MTRHWLIASIGALSFGLAACGDYDEKEYDVGNAAYEVQGNAAYDAGANQAYDAPEGNAAYPPPADGNAIDDTRVVVDPAPDTSTNRY